MDLYEMINTRNLDEMIKEAEIKFNNNDFESSFRLSALFLVFAETPGPVVSDKDRVMAISYETLSLTKITPIDLKETEKLLNRLFKDERKDEGGELIRKLLTSKIYLRQAQKCSSYIFVMKGELEPLDEPDPYLDFLKNKSVEDVAKYLIKIVDTGLKVKSDYLALLEERCVAARFLEDNAILEETKKRIAEIDPNNGWLKAKSSSSCFIATAVYESPFAPEVMWLREWRDQFLLKHLLGRVSVRAYYFISPYFANWISKSELKKRVIRKLLDRLINLLKRK